MLSINRRRAWSVRARLIILVTAVIVPLIAFAASLLWQYAAAERLRYRNEAFELSQRLANAVDRELVGLIAALEALATSPALQTGDLSTFDAQARAVLRNRGTFVAMRDQSGRALINTSQPFGTAIPNPTHPAVLAADRRVFETGSVTVSDLFTGTTTGLTLILINAPVQRDGATTFALNIALNPQTLATTLEQLTPPGWTSAVIDGRDRVVARSRQHDKFVGNEATADLRRNTTGPGGTWLGTTLEGTSIFGAYTRSSVSGWRVAVGIPFSIIDAPVQRFTWYLVGSATLVLTLSALLAALFARGIEHPLRRLSEAASSVGVGRQPSELSTGLLEADRVSRALAEASSALRQREAERDRAESESKAAETALRGSEARLQTIFETVPLGIVIAEAPSGRIIGGNSQVEAIFGHPVLPSADISGYREWVGFHPDGRQVEPSEYPLSRAILGEERPELEVLYKRGDGRDIWVRLIGAPMRNSSGEITGGVVACLDIDGRKRAEAALQETTRRLDAILNNTTMAVFMMDERQQCVYMNAAAEELTGYTLAETQGRPLHDVVHHTRPDGSHYPLSDCPIDQAFPANNQEQGEEVFVHKDGHFYPVAFTASPIRDDTGRPVGTVIEVRNIEEEVRARQELHAFNTQLEQRVTEAVAERNRIWHLSRDLLGVATFDGYFQTINPAWQRVLGWSEQEIKSRHFIDFVHPDDRSETRREIERLEQGVTTLLFENRYQHKDGSYRCLAWTAVPEEGRMYCVARDVTEEKEAAVALRRTEEQLRQSQKMEIVGQLTGGVAHDFNNLLTVVTGHLDMAQRRLDGADPRLHRNISNAIEGAQRAATLTHRLLAFSRQSPLKPDVVELNKVVGAMSELIRRTLGENIAIETVLAGGLWRTRADPNQIESAILNLCVNARDAMPDGGKLTIETANTHLDDGYPAVARGDVKSGQYVMIAVCDTGTGMTPEVRDRVFEPFFTTKPVGKGTGLGLSQVYGFLRQSGGHAGIYSEVGEGTTVKLYFPRLQRAGEAPARVSEMVETELVKGAGETILVVEDEAMVREFTVAALEESGYAVLSAPDGPSGLDLLDAHPEVQLLFTDVVLTGPMNGRNVADEALRRRPDLIVLFTTGYTRNAIVHHGRLDEGVELLTKPFTAKALNDKVARLLDGS